MQNIRESLFILQKCNNAINKVWYLLDEMKYDKNKVFEYGNILSNSIKLELVIFLEEYHNYFISYNYPEFSKKINDIKNINKPVIKRINRWKGLLKFRNNIIAHNWRDNGKFVLPDREKYNVPVNILEIKILVDLSNYLWSLISTEFNLEVIESNKYFVELKVPKYKKTNISNINKDLLVMAEEIDAICASLGKEYYLKVDQYVVE